MVGALVLLSLLLLASVLLLLVSVLLPLLLRCLYLMCFGGRRRGARLVVVSRKWGVMMPLWLVSLVFYPPAGVSRDTFLSTAELGHYQWAPTYCHFPGIPST
jgi:hypothetical protein